MLGNTAPVLYKIRVHTGSMKNTTKVKPGIVLDELLLVIRDCRQQFELGEIQIDLLSGLADFPGAVNAFAKLIDLAVNATAKRSMQTITPYWMKSEYSQSGPPASAWFSLHLKFSGSAATALARRLAVSAQNFRASSSVRPWLSMRSISPQRSVAPAMNRIRCRTIETCHLSMANYQLC